MPAGQDRAGAGLRRDLGPVQAYAALVGILVGAGIFRVTSHAWTLTGSSVIVGYLVLSLVLVATSVPYMVLLSTPEGGGPGGEYTHLQVMGTSPEVAAWAAWLKIVSYVGALAFLGEALADYALTLMPATAEPWRLWLAQGALTLFVTIHIAGVRWFGRVQVMMLAVLGVSVAILVVPGLFAIEARHYAPVFSGGAGGFAAALPSLFFAYAGFEAVAHAAGEVRSSQRSLPRVMLGGIAATTAIFVLMSVVAFGTVDGPTLGHSRAPRADVAATYLPPWAAVWVTIGALMALCTSLNATALVPSRLALVVAGDGRLPAALAAVHPSTGTPIIGLVTTWALATALLWTGQLSLALGVAVTALVIVYLLHSIAAWRAAPALASRAEVAIGPGLLRGCAAASIAALGTLLVAQAIADFASLGDTTFATRWSSGALTTVELLVLWSALGWLVLRAPGRRAGPA